MELLTRIDIELGCVLQAAIQDHHKVTEKYAKALGKESGSLSEDFILECFINPFCKELRESILYSSWPQWSWIQVQEIEVFKKDTPRRWVIECVVKSIIEKGNLTQMKHKLENHLLQNINAQIDGKPFFAPKVI